MTRWEGCGPGRSSAGAYCPVCTYREDCGWPATARRIAVIEPHADDAYLSLAGTLERWVAEGRLVHLVTVYGTPRRMSEASRYALSIGAAHTGLGYTESRCGLSGKRPPPRPLPSGVGKLIELVTQSSDLRVWPLGLQHPEHRLVAGLNPGEPVYVETPYQLTKKNGPELAGLLAGRTELLGTPGGDVRHRWHRVFKSQSLFMHRNPPEQLARAPELILAPSTKTYANSTPIGVDGSTVGG